MNSNEHVVTGTPRTLLRLEGLAMLAGGVAAFAMLGASWALFAVLFLVPDLSLLGYLANPRAGAHIYNAGCSAPRCSPRSRRRWPRSGSRTSASIARSAMASSTAPRSPRRTSFASAAPLPDH